jgi:integrase
LVYRRIGSNNWYYKFEFRGALIVKSTRQGNKRVAEQMEAAHRIRLAKAEVGIVERPPVPTVTDFAPRFLAHVRQKNASKPKTVKFYEGRTAALLASPILKDLPLDAITTEHQTAYAGWMRARQYEVSTINRSLATLRKMTRLLSEWDGTPCRRIKLLAGENKREFVLTAEQEAAYLAVALPLMRDVAIVMLDCGLRPEEVHRVKWDQYRDGFLTIFQGKQTSSRRRLEASSCVVQLLGQLPRTSPYVFPAPTKAGHIDASSYKKQLEKAIKGSGLPHFVPYSLRHTAITNLAMTGVDAPALMYWAGHKNLATTMNYIHLAADAIQKRMRSARKDASAKGSISFRTSKGDVA